MDARFKVVDEKFIAREKVDEQTAEALAGRLESMNEFRAQINAERGSYVTKDVLDALFKPLQTKATFASGVLWAAGVVGGVFGSAISMILYLLTAKGS